MRRAKNQNAVSSGDGVFSCVASYAVLCKNAITRNSVWDGSLSSRIYSLHTPVFSCPRCGHASVPEFWQQTHNTASPWPPRARIWYAIPASRISTRACSGLFLTASLLQRSSFCVLPRGWTQAEIVALGMNGIKMDEGAAVDNAETVFPERLIVRLGAVALMLFKSIQRVLRGQLYHESVAQNLRRDRGE